MGNTPSPQEHGWRDLYLAAVFEKDRTQLPQKISDARTAISARMRALCASESDRGERQVLDNALFSLGALRLCLAIAANPQRVRAPR